MSEPGPPLSTKVIPFAAFHRNTGRSTLLAALAVRLSREKRVLVLDADISAPQQQTLLGVPARNVEFTLNDHLVGLCDLAQTVQDLSGPQKNHAGALYMIPASDDLSVASRTLREEYDSAVLIQDLQKLAQTLRIDCVLIDMPVGLSGTTLPLMSISDLLMVVVRIEKKDYEGIGVIIDVARKLDVPHLMLNVNMVHRTYPLDEVRHKFSESYQVETHAFPHITPLSTSPEGEEAMQELCTRIRELG